MSTTPTPTAQPALAIERLSEAAQTVLAALAITPAGLSRKALQAVLRVYQLNIDGKQPDDQRLKALLTTLRKLGYLARTTGDTRQPARLIPELRNRVLRWLVARPDFEPWAQQLEQTLSMSWDWHASASAHHAPHVWRYLLSNQADKLVPHLIGLLSHTDDIAANHPLPLLLADADGQHIFTHLGAPMRAVLLENWLHAVNFYVWDHADTIWLLGLALCENEATQLDATLRAALAEQVLVQAFLRGDLERVHRLRQAIAETENLAAFLLALAQGQAPAALAAIERWLPQVRKRIGKRKIQLPRPLQTLHWIALIGDGSPAAIAQLDKQLAAHKILLPGLLLLRALVDTRQGRMHTVQVPKIKQIPHPTYPLDHLLTLLTLHWLGEPIDTAWLSASSKQCAQWEKNDYPYAWLRAELNAVLDHYGHGSKTCADWHAQRGFKPLLKLYQRREPWQHALDALAALTQARDPHVKPDTTAAPEKRLVWWLDGLNTRHRSTTSASPEDIRIEPREQKCNAKGQWSKGRPVALQRLLEHAQDFDYLSASDRAVVATIRQEYVDYYGNPRWFIPAQAALPRLIGHPHLYRAEAPDVPIDLQAGQASLHLEEKNGQIHLHLHPPEMARHPHGLLHPETPTLLKFYPQDASIARIADIVGNGLAIPASARAQLIQAVSAIAPMLPVHSDIAELTAHLDTVEADATLYAHLLPLAEGLRLQLLVRPLAGGAWLRPGQGAASLVGEQDGKPVQARRNLAGERTRLDTVLEHCPALAAGDGDGQEWRFEAAADALQLLSELHALTEDQVTCVWPEGERMRIRARPGMGNLRLSLARQNDWFALQGEIELDDGRVLQLKQLLDLMRASRGGRFVPLGAGDWLALSDDLRRRLADVAHVADKIDARGARLSALHAPLIETLAEEAAEFQADAAWQAQRKRLQSMRAFTPQVPRLLQAELRDYQRTGFVWLARLAAWGVGACLADDMGLGKTVQLLALLLHRASAGPQLVVAPTSVVANWQGEALRFAPSLRLSDYRQTRTLEHLGAGDVVLVSYGLLQNEQQTFAAQTWTTVVLDEAQAVKNPQTKRSHAVMALQADFRVIASGTPLENHLGELWNLMRFLNPGLLGSQQRFAERFAAPIENGDSNARRALKQLIQPFLLRRLKSAVLDELPARTDITHKIPLSDAERHQYEALRQQAVAALAGGNLTSGDARFEALAHITRLRRFCCHPSLILPDSPLQSSKLQALQHIVAELRDNGHRALVFSQFVDHLAIVRRALDAAHIPYQYLDGSTPPAARSAAVAAFQAGAGDIFLISLKAGGSGLNLTGADYVIHLDPWWNPAVEDQASDRAHRIGQQRPVTVYRLVAENTIEEQIVALHAHKRDLADSLLEGGQTSARLDAEALLALIRQG